MRSLLAELRGDASTDEVHGCKKAVDPAAKTASAGSLMDLIAEGGVGRLRPIADLDAVLSP